MESNRRDFLKLSALAGAGFMVGGLPMQVAANVAVGGIGSLTTAALIDDALRLTRHADRVSPAFRESLVTGMNVWNGLPGDVAQFGSLMQASQADVLGVLERIRDEWPQDRQERNLDGKLALVAGWLVAQTAQEVMSRHGFDVEAGIYQDAALLRARSAGRKGEARPEEVVALFREMAPRTMTRFHTLKPDDDDAMGWILRLRDWRKEHYERMQLYADAYARPDRRALQRYVEEPNFYDASDPAIELARELRQDDPQSSVNVLVAIEADNESLYGRALARAVHDLLAASSFFEGELDDRELAQQLALR